MLLRTVVSVALLSTSAEASAMDLQATKLVQGRQVTFTVAGAKPNATVYLYVGKVRGSGPCVTGSTPRTCLDIRQPTTLGSRRADASGVATWVVTAPTTLPSGTWLFQAVHGGSSARETGVTPLSIYRKVVGDLMVGDPATVQDVAEVTGELELTYASGVVSLPNLDTVGSIWGESGPADLAGITELLLPGLARIGVGRGGWSVHLQEHFCSNIDLSAWETNPDLPVAEYNRIHYGGGHLDVSSLTVGWAQGGTLPGAHAIEITAPALVGRAGDRYSGVGANGRVAGLHVPNLEHGAVYVQGEQGSGSTLSTLTLPALVGGSVSLSYLDALTAFGAPLLAEGDVTVRYNAALPVVDLPSMSTGTIHVNDNPALTALYIPSFTTGELDLQHNASLAMLDAAPIVGSYVQILDNPALPSCLVESELAGVSYVCGGNLADVCTNDGVGSCY